ncbi:waprin-Phi2-like [Oculina patagonica]
MKRFIFAVVLLSIVCTLLSDEVMGSSIRNKREKPGQCPKPGIGTCVEGCSGDGDCNGEDKCCFNGCGHTCMKPVKPPKPGCPKPGVGICVEACSSDDDCREGELCCYNGCGHSCFPL